MTIKLNLGCGGRRLAGYVNVDAVARGEVPPDVIADIRNLQGVFEDDYADEILSVHVIEHIARGEVAAMLAEWVRVLKPGGKLVIECPNLIEACKKLIASGDEAALEDKRGQFTMWVLYGDPSQGDDYMIHRWGYTPFTLRKLLEEIGLTEIEQKPAMFKKREPRDMRMIGVKP